MKIKLNAKELRELKTCNSGYNTFFEAHGENDVTLSQALDSNGWDDIWWFIAEAYDKFSQEQKNQLHLIGCDWAERTLVNFEKQFPDDKRPREAIEAKRAFVKGKINKEELDAARSAAESARSARSAARSARSAAEYAAESAARSAAWSAWSAAESARSARSAARSAAEYAAESAARSARSAAEYAARSARSAAEYAAEYAWSTAMDEMTKELRALFIEWEAKEGVRIQVDLKQSSV